MSNKITESNIGLTELPGSYWAITAVLVAANYFASNFAISQLSLADRDIWLFGFLSGVWLMAILGAMYLWYNE